MPKISLGDLKRREYTPDKNCVRFDFEMRFESDDLVLVPDGVVNFEFIKNPLDTVSWWVYARFPSTPWLGAKTYEFELTTPNASVSTNILKVCKMGLNAFKTAVTMEQHDGSVLLFGISELLED